MKSTPEIMHTFVFHIFCRPPEDAPCQQTSERILSGRTVCGYICFSTPSPGGCGLLCKYLLLMDQSQLRPHAKRRGDNVPRPRIGQRGRLNGAKAELPTLCAAAKKVQDK